MEKFKHIRQIKDIYSKGGNIIDYLKQWGLNGENTIEDILISYDLQSGSYIQGFVKNSEYIKNYSKALSEEMENLGNFETILEVGVGEATTLVSVVKNLVNKPEEVLGLDISWSRLKFAKELIKDYRIPNSRLFTANLFEIPLKDNSVDVVYTSHAIEPNGGREKEALKELYRVAKKYVILLEPSFEFADEKGRERMQKHGYVTSLYSSALELEYTILEHRLFEYISNPLNPTGLLIIEKQTDKSNYTDYICPVSNTELYNYSETLLYSDESCLAYPVIEGIPCLLKGNSILASHLQTDYKTFKKTHRIVYPQS